MGRAGIGPMKPNSGVTSRQLIRPNKKARLRSPTGPSSPERRVNLENPDPLTCHLEELLIRYARGEIIYHPTVSVNIAN